MKPNSILIDSFITYKQNIFFNFKKDLSLIKDKDFKNEITTKFSKETLIDDLISIYEMFVIFWNFLNLFLDSNYLKLRQI